MVDVIDRTVEDIERASRGHLPPDLIRLMCQEHEGLVMLQRAVNDLAVAQRVLMETIATFGVGMDVMNSKMKKFDKKYENKYSDILKAEDQS